MATQTITIEVRLTDEDLTNISDAFEVARRSYLFNEPDARTLAKIKDAQRKLQAKNA